MTLGFLKMETNERMRILTIEAYRSLFMTGCVGLIVRDEGVKCEVFNEMLGEVDLY